MAETVRLAVDVLGAAVGIFVAVCVVVTVGLLAVAMGILGMRISVRKFRRYLALKFCQSFRFSLALVVQGQV